MLFIKWRLKIVILYLLFYSVFAPPPGKRPASDDATHGGKKNKENEYEECYFNKIRKTEFEKRPRSDITSVDELCSGNLISFAELVANTDEKFTKLRAPNEAGIILARGAGEFHDFNDETVVYEISQRKICPYHRNELSSQWEKSKHVKRKHYKSACSIPPTLPNPLNHQLLVNAIYGAVSYIAAQAVLHVNQTLIHVGAPRCQAHQNMITASLNIFQNQNAKVVEKSSIESCPEISPKLPERDAKVNAPCYYEEPIEEDQFEIDEPIKSAFFTLLRKMKQPTNVISRKWNKLQRTSKHNYVTVLNKVYDTAAIILGGKDSHKQLKTEAVSKLLPKTTTDAPNHAQKELLQELKLRFYTAESKCERRTYLSLFAEVLPLPIIQDVIPDLNPFQYTEAKKVSKRSKSHQQKPAKRSRERVKKPLVEKFVKFFTSEIFTTGIPFGRIKKKLSNKKVVELPVTVRELRDSKIIQKYKNFMAEKGEIVGMSDSTLRKILKACPAKRKISLRAVDEQKGDGILAFEWMIEMVTDLESKNLINKDESDDFKNRLTEAEFFFRTDYYMLLTYDHHSADFCITYALSDPRTSEYRAVDHFKENHRYRTSRAHIFKNLIKELQNIIESIEGTDEETILDIANYKITIEESEYFVNKWQGHIVRARFSDDRRADLSTLQNGEAFVTVDFAQRWQPHYFREKQSMYYGKAGNCFSVLHCLSQQSGALVQHTIVHFLGYCEQDYVTVTAILLDAFKLLAEKGVTKLKLRSDNASYYHNPALILTMPAIGKKAGLNVDFYSFSEAQNGKGIADMMASLIKATLLDYGHQGNDVATADQMFDAINDAIQNGYLDGVTAVKAVRVPTKTGNTKLNIPNVQYLGEFEYAGDEDDIKFWKHYNIGEGKSMKIPEAAQKLPLQTLEGTTKTDPTPLFWREKTLIIKNPKEKKEKEVKTTPAPPLNEDEIEPLYQCEVPGCQFESLKSENYQKHKLLGRHSSVPVKETVEEQAHQLFYDYVTGRKNKHNFFIENAMSEADVEMDISEVAPEGWALKQPPRRVKYTKEMEEFLNNEYVNYAKSGRKRFDPYCIQQKMRKSRKPMFTAEQRLPASKITSYFNSRKNKLEALAKKVINAEEEAKSIKEASEEFQQNLQNDNFETTHDEDHEEIRTLNNILKKVKTNEDKSEFIFEEGEDETDIEDDEDDDYC